MVKEETALKYVEANEANFLATKSEDYKQKYSKKTLQQKYSSISSALSRLNKKSDGKITTKTEVIAAFKVIKNAIDNVNDDVISYIKTSIEETSNLIETRAERKRQKEVKDAQNEIAQALKKVEELKTKFNLTDEQIEELKAEIESKQVTE